MIYSIRCIVGSAKYYKFGRYRSQRLGENAAYKRLLELQIGCPFELELIAVGKWPEWEDQERERRIHNYLQASRVRGEWFKGCERVTEILRMMGAGEDVPPVPDGHIVHSPIKRRRRRQLTPPVPLGYIRVRS